MKFNNFIFNRTVLLMSVYEQNVEIVKLLLERKDTDVNIKSITKNIFCNKV